MWSTAAATPGVALSLPASAQPRLSGSEVMPTRLVLPSKASSPLVWIAIGSMVPDSQAIGSGEPPPLLGPPASGVPDMLVHTRFTHAKPSRQSPWTLHAVL